MQTIFPGMQTLMPSMRSGPGRARRTSVADSGRAEAAENFAYEEGEGSRILPSPVQKKVWNLREQMDLADLAGLMGRRA